MPPLPYPGARAVRFDDAAAVDCIRRFEDLADRLDALRRIDHDRLRACTAEWRGVSRHWFDRSNEEAVAAVARAASAARHAAATLRRNISVAERMQTEVNDHARRADLVSLARLAALALPAAD